jgi:hypothetical protein
LFWSKSPVRQGRLLSLDSKPISEKEISFSSKVHLEAIFSEPFVTVTGALKDSADKNETIKKTKKRDIKNLERMKINEHRSN